MFFSQLCTTAIEAALLAGKILRDGFGTTFMISSKKERHDLVTEFDIKCEKSIINHIKEHYPNHIFLAEESGESGNIVLSNSSTRWIIDPLDGTVNFAHSIPIFAVSIAAEVNGELTCGVVYHPMLNELFVAEKGKGAWLNGKQLHVSSAPKLSESFLVTGFPYNISANPSEFIDIFYRFLKLGIPIRRLGSAALDLAYVAAGRFDGFWEAGLSPWDVAAGVLIIKEAGGKVTQYSGESYSITDKSIVATNALIHDEIIEVFR